MCIRDSSSADECAAQQVIELAVARMSARTVATGQTVLSINIDACATNTDVRADKWCSETQTDGDTDSCVVHLQASRLEQSMVAVRSASRRSPENEHREDEHGQLGHGCIE